MIDMIIDHPMRMLGLLVVTLLLTFTLTFALTARRH